MVKFRYEWFLFDYKDGAPDVMPKPFKTKAAAEKTPTPSNHLIRHYFPGELICLAVPVRSWRCSSR